MTLVGFKRAIIRVLDGTNTITEGKNLFTIEGKKDKGATQTAAISGLATTPVVTYGSNLAYHTSRKGVGEVKAEITAVDVPFAVQDVILGRKKVDGLTAIGVDTEPPLCSLTLVSEDARGTEVAIGFFAGVFSFESFDLNTKKAESEELQSDTLTFTAQASDAEESDGIYVMIGSGSEEITKLKVKMGVTTAG